MWCGGKPAFPDAKHEVEILIMGTRIRAQYDPRNGPDRSRSGVLKIGLEQLRTLNGGPHTLTFRVANDGPEFT